MRKRVIISVISDLATDQRVHRSAMALHEEGWDVLLVGRVLPQSPAVDERPYATKRFKLWFNKGPLFYVNYNITLFFFLMIKRAHVLLSNDLDTLLANFLSSRLKNISLVYDSHEYFTGVPELAERRIVRGTWKFIEKLLLPQVKYLFTVNQSIADLYEKDYGVHFKVMRNVPMRTAPMNPDKMSLRKELELPADKFIFILQGSGINIQRGAEEAVEAMAYINNAMLLIVGGGDVVSVLKANAARFGEKVKFVGRVDYNTLRKYTSCADVGLTLDKDTNINYRFSLPNKIFDYIQAGIPVLASDLPEIKKIIVQYDLGMIAESHNPEKLAQVMKEMMHDVDRLTKWKQHTVVAAAALNWDKEKSVLTDTFKSLD